MPALIANTVTLEEVLEVRAGPLNEEELWSVLSQSCEALQDVFIRGKARKRHFGTYTITPATILLCHTGKVKFALEADSPNDRSYTAPETYARRAFPSEAALEKICVYSLGMSLYHAAEFEVAVGKPISLHEPLENVLLSMCEDSAQLRSTLAEVLQECHSHYRSKNYRDVVASLVESLLGDEIPDIELEDTEFDNEATSDYDINGEVYSSSISPVLASPRHLPTPPPPQISTRGQATSAQLVGSNHRPVLTPPLTQRSTSPRLNGSRNLPPSLEKYKSFLEDSRSKRSIAASLNGLDQLDSREPSSSYLQRPPKQQRMTERTSPQYHEVPEIPDRYERQPSRLSPDLEPRLKVSGNNKGVGGGLRRFSSANSVTSVSSSSASGPRSSKFSDGRSSSAVSLTQGSYAPESYLTDGYDSEFYLNSLGSSVSRNHFRDGREAPSLRDQKYVSVHDLRQPPGQGSIPRVQMSSGKQFTSMPDINKQPLLGQSRKNGASPNDPVKTFFGPEFVMITEDPEKSIVNITPNAYLKKDAQQKKGGSQNRKMVTVVALNGQKLQLMAEVTMTTKDLYDHVIKFLKITEKSFFGLAKLEDDEVIFLELDVKLSKYAPPKWKESKVEMVEFILYFRVKFYVEHLALLSHLSTRHQFYLQLRKDVLEGRLYCHEEAAFILGGLALQAETGDFDDSLDQEYFLVEHYLHPRVINKVSPEYVISQLPEYHQKFTGLTEEQAELGFLEEAQKLPEYGIHFYKVQANKKSDAEKLYLGICVRGITVYEAMGHIKSPIHKHSWPLTKKISFKKKKFFIEPRGNPDGAKLTFYTNHYKKAKYLLSMCTAFHRFQMKMRTRLAAIEHEVALDLASEKQQQQQLSVDIPPPKPSPYERTPPFYKQNSVDTQRDTLPRSVSQEYVKQNTEDSQQYREMPVDVNHNIGFHGNGVSDRNKLGKRMFSVPSIKDDLDKEKHDNDVPYVIDSTLNDPRKLESQQDVVKDNLHPNTDTEVPRPKDILKSPDREIRVIKLVKEPLKGLGITVLGGENSRRLDLGIYVKSITEGGAAAKDGRLKAGDRILAVNGNSVENVSHEQAVSLLKTTSSTVELVVSQSPHNISALDLSNIPSATSANEEPQTLEVKPLITPPQHNAQLKQQQHVESPWSSDTQSPTESPASTFNFPSEDEPVTMISKSISSLAANPPTSKKLDHPVLKRDPYRDITRLEERVPEPVTVVTVESLNSQPIEMMSQDEPAPPLADSRVSSMDSHQSDLSSESYTAGSERSTDHEIPDKSFIVELEKENSSLGLSVTGGINTTVKHGAIFVKSLILNGPADLNGNVRVGDRILEVNGISLKSVTHKQAVEIIKRAPQHCKLLIDRSIHVNVPTSIKKTLTRSKTPERPFVVELMKGIGGLGLSLVGGRDADLEHGGRLRIKKMFPGQPAALSNRLQVGDIVLKVNDNSLENASHQDAINMIRLEPSVVRLLIKREPSSIPAVLLNRAASDASDIDPVQLLSDIQSKLRSDVKSPQQEPHKQHFTLKPEPQLEVTNERDLPDRTEVWVKQESPKPRGYVFENDRSLLTHQLSDPSAVIPRHVEHEPVSTSHSLPGKFAVKPRYFENVPEEHKIRSRSPVHSSETDITETLARKDSDKLVSESDLPSLLKHLKSQDSLHRTMSPRAPLAEYDESDIDEGIMISVDDGTIVHIDDDDRSDDDDDNDIDTTLTNAVPPVSDDDDDIHRPAAFSKIDSTFEDDDDGKRTASKTIPTLPTAAYISAAADNDDDDDDEDDDSTVDSQNSEEDIDEVLKLLDAAHRDTTIKSTNSISSGKSDVTTEQSEHDDEISVDIQETLPEQSPNSLDFSSGIIGTDIDRTEDDINTDRYETHEDVNRLTNMYRTEDEQIENTDVYRTESQPYTISLEDEKVNNDDHLTSFSAINGDIRPGNHSDDDDDDDDDDESDSDVSLGKYVGEVQDGEEEKEETEADLTLKVEDDNSSILTPKEELITVELEKGDSGGLGFTLAGGADTMGGCFVRDIIGDPAKSDGRLQKGDQILQVVSDSNSGQLESVNLTRTSRGRIGLLLIEGDEGVILVDDVVPGEPAAVEGNLKHGDRIVEIGGHKVDGIGFLAARQYLDAARPVVQLLVERRNRAALSKYSMSGASLEQSFSLSEDLAVSDNVLSDEDNIEDNQQPVFEEQKEDEIIKIELDKGPRGFGFSLVAAPSSEPNVQGIFIKTISPGSVAEKDGRLRVGDQILTVNQEDVHGLSHARVIGMLRKVTTTVTMEIRRPRDTVSKEEKPSITSPSKNTNRSPPSNSLDLDITLEDKETLTGSSEVKDEDDIVDLLTAISSANSQTTPTTTPTKPKLSKRDTDSVLSSLLTSIGSSSPSSNVNYLNEVDSNDSNSDNDTGSPPDSLGYPPLSTDSLTLNSESSQRRADSPEQMESPSHESPPQSRGSPPLSRGSSISVDYPPLNLDSSIDNIISSNSLQRFSSGSSQEKKLSISSNEKLQSESEETSSDSDYDVFDMLHDNSEKNTQKQSNDIAKQTQEDLAKIIDSYASTPPPLPTTPIPSDDEDDRPPPPPRKESLLKSYEDNWSSAESDFSSQPKVNGFVSLHSSSSEGEMMSRPSQPLVDVTPGGKYTGHKLKMLIGALQSKLNSNAPSEEFKALRGIKPTDGCEAAKHPDNKEKNRYRNVLPFDETRVRLSGEGNDDYINASHIRVPVGQDTYHYIATQGPLPNTIRDFWQMIWEQGIEVIAMVTLEHEGGKAKCSKYWPDSPDKPLLVPSFEVSLQEKSTSESFVERKISLKHLETGDSIDVIHLNFTTWPDHGVPKCSVEIVQFVKYMRHLTSTQAPILVHCSAGIGRTGALITVDVALGLMHRDLLFDVDKIIRILREQRQGMIQTKDQYIFCYKACLEVLRSLVV